MKRIILLVLVLGPVLIFAQQSIQPSDIEIYSQLTLLKVTSEDVPNFEKDMAALSRLSKQIELEEHYDWLTYKSDEGDYLIVNFSNGIKDVLTIESYEAAFHEKGVGSAFDNALQSMAGHGISVERNCLIQMLLPWSTVNAISVSQFPLATMVEYSVPANSIEQFDVAMRKLAILLKKVGYPYPLESNRGSVGAYGTMNLVWFYDDRDAYFGKNSLLEWMDRQGGHDECRAIMETIKRLSRFTKTHHFDYQKEMSY